MAKQTGSWTAGELQMTSAVAWTGCSAAPGNPASLLRSW